MSFYHASPLVRPGMLATPGVVHSPLPPGTVLQGSFKLVDGQRPFYDKVFGALPQPGEVAQALLPGLRNVIDNPGLKGVLDSVVIEAVTEYVRGKEFPDRPSRLVCVFGSESIERAEAFARRFRPGAPHIIYEVEPAAETWFADMDTITAGFDYFTMSFPETLTRQLDRARSYLEQTTKDAARAVAMKDPEVLSPGGAKVLKTASVVA